MSNTKQIITKKSKPTRRFPTAVWNYIKDFAGIKNSKIYNNFLSPLPDKDIVVIKRLKKIFKEIDAMPRWVEDIVRWKYNDHCYDDYKKPLENEADFADWWGCDINEFYKLRRYIQALDLTEANSGCDTIVKECIARFQKDEEHCEDNKQSNED